MVQKRRHITYDDDDDDDQSNIIKKQQAFKIHTEVHQRTINLMMNAARNMDLSSLTTSQESCNPIDSDGDSDSGSGTQSDASSYYQQPYW